MQKSAMYGIDSETYETPNAEMKQQAGAFYGTAFHMATELPLTGNKHIRTSTHVSASFLTLFERINQPRTSYL